MNEFDSIRITEKGDTLSFEMTNELADSSHEAIFFLIRATSALIASVAKDDADPKEVAEAFGKVFTKHVARTSRTSGASGQRKKQGKEAAEHEKSVKMNRKRFIKLTAGEFDLRPGSSRTPLWAW